MSKTQIGSQLFRLLQSQQKGLPKLDNLIYRGFATQEQREVKRDYSLEGKYAFSLYKVANQSNSLNNVVKDLDLLKTSLAKYSDFGDFLKDPASPRDKKLEFTKQVLASIKANKTTVNFIETLGEFNRLRNLDKIINAFDSLTQQSGGNLAVKVTVAQEPSQKDKDDILAGLGKYMGIPKNKVNAEFKVDPSIIGGQLYEIGDTLINCSVATQVNELYNDILQSGS